MNAVWVLTGEHNDYNQYGEYFLAWWPQKPTKDDLRACSVPEDRLDHVLNGGGRVVGPGNYYDDQWYHLRLTKAGA